MSRTLAMTLVLSGCATVASRGDYRDYRAVRLAADDSERLVAMSAYLDAHPDGNWSPEISSARAEMEPTFFEESKSTADGLRLYLSTYPQGVYVDQARSRLAALDAVARSRAGDAEADREVTREQREAQLERRRQWASYAVAYWTRILLGVENWGAPIGEVAAANQAFDDAFGANPRPRCTREECIKFYQLDYAIAVPGQTQMQRVIRLLLRLRFDADQKLVRAELLMPDRGFSRWYEVENQEPVIDQDPEARQATIEWALERIVPIVREIAPTARGIDVVPEPIDPPRVRAPNQPDPGASARPGEDQSASPAGPATVEVVEPPSDDSLVLPLAIQGLRVGDMRVVVFAAADDDEGAAYDGLFIEFQPDAS